MIVISNIGNKFLLDNKKEYIYDNKKKKEENISDTFKTILEKEEQKIEDDEFER